MDEEKQREPQEELLGPESGSGNVPVETPKVSLPLMNDSWYGRPVLEVDPLIFEDTFCIVSNRFNRNYIYRFSSSKSLFLFGAMNPIRRFAVFMTTHRWFDTLIIATILCNCVTLAMITNLFDPVTNQKMTPSFDVYIDHIELVFLGIYTVEMVFKILAKGMVLNKFSYMRNRWNLLDLVVVISGYITLIKDMLYGEDANNELDFLRTFRVLRVVKTISIFPGLRMMINALLSSVTQLLEVMTLTIICLMIFSLFGLEIFQGCLRQKCVIDKGGRGDPERLISAPIEEDEELELRDQKWTEWVTDWKNWKRRDFPDDEPMFCGNGTDKRMCPEGSTCIGFIGDNPDDGWTSFETFFHSMMSTFQLLTLDYWERLYDIVVSTCGAGALLFFILVIFLGAYYLLNLMLAVVAMSYENEASSQDRGPVGAMEKLGVARKMSNFSFDDLAKLNICKMTHYRKRTKSEREQLARRIRMASLSEEALHKKHAEEENANLRLDDAIFNLLGMKLTLKTEGGSGGSYIESSEKMVKLDEESGGGGVSLSHRDPDNRDGAGEGAGDQDGVRATASEILSGGRSRSDVEVDMLSKAASQWKQTNYRVCVWWSLFLEGCRIKLTPFVGHQIFEWFITICIILNTIVLAMEHHGETKETSEVFKKFNSVFMGVFTFECVVKLLALQGDFCKSGWNRFDLVIVLVSYLDLLMAEYFSDGKGSSSLSVMRSMRLLRVFKLANSWVTMKVLLNIIFSSFAALGNLTMVLLIILYIFAVMGMQVVGGQYTPSALNAMKNPSKFPQWHFRHFWYAFMMVFRVLCGEWIEPLWECLKAQQYYIEHHLSPNAEVGEEPKRAFIPYLKCFIIFLPILVVGNFIVLNLFLALLLNSFDTEELNSQRDRELEEKGKAENLKNIVGLLMRKPTVTVVVDEDGDVRSLSGEGDGDSGSIGGTHIHVSGSGTSVTSVKRKTVSFEGFIQDKVVRLTPNGPEPFMKMKGSSSSSIALPESAAKKRFKKAVNQIILQHRIKDAARAIARMENHRLRMKNMIAPKLFLANPAGKGNNRDYDRTPDSSEEESELQTVGDCIPAAVCACACAKKSGKRRSSYIPDCTCTDSQCWDSFRQGCHAIVTHSTFEWTILSLILASSFTLIFEDIHLRDKPVLERNLEILNTTFTILFVMEMLLKWFAIGIWRYFTSFWTILDGFIVGVSLVSAYIDMTMDPDALESGAVKKGGSLAALKALRTLRALRPLRAISRWQGMKIVVNALMYAIPSIFNVLLVCLLFWLVFSIMGVQFFKGEFYRCVDEMGERVDWRLAPNKEVCCAKSFTHGYSWMNTVSNYDNVFEGYLSLLQVATFEGWMELMSYSVDARGVNNQPVTDSQIAYYAFYVVFIIFGSFFTLQLFIGVIIDNFNMLKKKYEGNMLEILLTPTQRNYYIAMKNLGKRKPKAVIQRPSCKFLGFFYDMAMSRKLEVVIFIMIFLNMVQAGFEYVGQGQKIDHGMKGTDAFFNCVYVLEALIKILGLGSFYFTVPWNVFDFGLVGTSLIDGFVAGDLSVSLPIPPTMLRVVRVVRIGRILRLVKAAAGIRKLLFALVVSLPALFNIGALLALITFIYAILGMALFGKAPKKWSVYDVFNFETFYSSNLMLLRLMTAAGWNEILDSLTVVEPVCGTYRHIICGEPGEPECPNRALVVAYIVTYLVLTYLIVINLYIAIILENYVEASNEEDVGIVEDDLEMFYVHWSRYDPYASQFIDFEYLTEFLDSLDPPLRVQKPNIVAIVAFNLPIARGNKVHCLDILQALISHVLGQVDDTREFRKLQGQMSHKFQRQFPNRRLLDIVSSTRRWRMEQNAAIIIQRAWRAYWRRKHPQEEGAPAPVHRAHYMGKSTKPSVRELPDGTLHHGGLGHMMERMGNVPR